jgi:lipopolysaccharide transport system ATP-binding protein
MSDTVIKVENLSKQYRLGEVGTGTLSHDLNRWWHKIRGKEDPYLKLSEVNDRAEKGSSDYVWALQDINFEVKQGEVLGIIGRNGAGKSTLLKILSKTTAPTTGRIRAKGRVASLLEVGTGFHPEMTGKENIFLNGAILGMTRKEIRQKFDEIVDFAGVEKYVDTPVKRYSSGMYVRLAFAVAAHLEPEILVVDEVLAVGDAEFQKRCLGKMEDASKKEGRTVLFVSHQMDSISRLCKNTIVLENGKTIYQGNSEMGISFYLKGNHGTTAYRSWEKLYVKPGNEICRLLEVKILNKENEVSEYLDIDEPVKIIFIYEVLVNNVYLTHGLNLFNFNGVHILSSHDTETAKRKEIFSAGLYEASLTIPGNFLAEGMHSISVAVMSYESSEVHFHEYDAASFVIVDKGRINSARGIYGGNMPGIIRPLFFWGVEKK